MVNHGTQPKQKEQESEKPDQLLGGENSRGKRHAIS